MNKIKVAKQLLKLANDLLYSNKNVQIDEKLYNLKSKQGVKNYIYKSVKDLTKGKFRDEDWRNVTNVFNAIKDLGVNVDWYVENGGYSVDQSSKTYKFNIDFVNFEGKTFELKGQLICCFCGTVEDPMSAYDMVFQIF